MKTNHLARIRLIFLIAVLCILGSLFTVGVGLRTQELALLTAVGRSVSAAGFRTQYALASQGNNSAAALLAFDQQNASSTNASAHAASVPVLLYHGIVASTDRFSLTQDTFKDQLFALKRAGYQTISLADFIAFEKGEKQLPAKSFLLTFDDGRVDSYERGDPVLEALGYTAVMYVATEDSLDPEQTHSAYYLDQPQIARMIASGRWEIGSHMRQVGGGFVPLDASGTKGNFLSNRWWHASGIEDEAAYTARVQDELGTSKQLLTKAFNVPIETMSYPFGDYGQQEVNEPNAETIISRAAHQNYEIAFQQVWPGEGTYSTNYPNEDPYHLRRVEVDTHWNGTQLLAFMNGITQHPLPYTEPFGANPAWKHNWGDITMRDASLTLDAAADSTGALTFLDGTGDWKWYRYSVDAQLKAGTTLGLIARFQDEGNFLSCTFSDGIVRLKETISSKEYVLKEVHAHVPHEAALSMVVNGSSASCAVNGERVTSGTFAGQLLRGGIGLTIWDNTPGAASATVTQLTVEPL